MKITKYNQSCLLIETNEKRILIDPGNVGYTEEILQKDWTNIHVILVTHKHEDHCHVEAINKIIERDGAQLYTCQEVVDMYSLINPIIVKAGDKFKVDSITIEATKAIHGFITPMKNTPREVKENIGFIIDDGITRLYDTSDTINFNNNYQCDILCMPFNGNGLTLGLIDGVMFLKDINPKLVIPIHMQPPNPLMIPNVEQLENILKQYHINYKLLQIGETLEYV